MKFSDILTPVYLAQYPKYLQTYSNLSLPWKFAGIISNRKLDFNTRYLSVYSMSDISVQN